MRTLRTLSAVMAFCAVLLAGSLQLLAVNAAEQEGAEETADYTNPETGYRVLIEDEAELLTKEQRAELSQVMQEITKYGNAAFVTVESNSRSTESFAGSYYMERFGADSGTVFVIDMDNRKIWIHSDGALYKTVTKANADTVTDNVYRYASNEDYYECAAEAFREICALLEGQRIARPMKYISNALLAMILALLANFGLIIWFSRLHKPGADTVLADIHRKFSYSSLRAVHSHQTRIYDPPSGGSSGSSGGWSGGSGGRSGGGGHSSGGGGGHSF